MAVKDSNEIATDSNYSLGDYSFHVERSAGTSPNYDKIEAICTKDGKNARKSIQVDSKTKLNGYYVEANGTEATVYAIVDYPTYSEDEKSSDFYHDVPYGSYVHVERGRYDSVTVAGNRVVANSSGSRLIAALANTSEIFTIQYDQDTPREEHASGSGYTYQGKTAYWGGVDIVDGSVVSIDGPTLSPEMSRNLDTGKLAWTLVYGTDSGEIEYEERVMLVGRFAIELEDAGGVGPGSDWVDPGDYDPDWEPEDPTHTLYVTVTGALSGRHNDPIVDSSYSYIPSDKDTVKDYGCGGDGGHGGGGGAGASTVVVHKFATNQANSKEVTAIARRHGYGSGGGKGGKGGDGCILVYY